MKTEKINIADILRNEPAGTRLYSPVCGALEFTNVIDGDRWCHLVYGALFVFDSTSDKFHLLW